jgi:hypothetical protein
MCCCRQGVEVRFSAHYGLTSEIAPLPRSAKLGPRAASELGPFIPGGLNRSTQHFILEGKDGVWDGTKIS